MKKSVNGSNIVIYGRFLKLLCWLAVLTMRTGPAADEIQAQSPQLDLENQKKNSIFKVIFKYIKFHFS